MKVAVLAGTKMHKGGAGPGISTIETVLKAAKKYDEIFCFSNDHHISDIRKEMLSVFRNLRGQRIEELLFYYSGHIDFFNNEFCYVITDFEKRTRKLIENSEVDHWLRILQPRLAVKIVDGCHDGTALDKDEGIERCLRKAQERLSRCLLIFFSRNDQISEWNWGCLTRSFLQAIRDHKGQELTYSEMADFISRQLRSGFHRNRGRLFVSPSSFGEVFCRITPEVKGAAGDDELIWIKLPAPADLALEQAVRQDAERYLNQEKVMGILEQLRKRISSHSYSSVLIQLYKVHHSFEDCLFGAIPKQDEVGSWLERNRHDYFAEPLFEEEVGQKETKPLRPLGSTMVQERSENKAGHSKRRVKGYKLTADCPFNQIQIRADARYPNIPSFNCTFLFVFSKAGIRFFYFYTHYLERNWNVRELNKDVDWQNVELSFTDTEDLFARIGKIQDEFAGFILRELKKRFGLKEVEEERKSEGVYQLANRWQDVDSEHSPSPLDDILLAITQERELKKKDG